MTVRVDEQLRHDIVAAVREVERGSAVEVVVTIVPRSAPHWDVTLGAALAATFSVLLVVGFLLPDSGPIDATLDAALAAVLAAVATRRLPKLQRTLLPAAAAAHRVEQGAESAFCRQGIFRTKHHVGVLVYVSLLERRAVLIFDDGVAHALPKEALEALRAEAASLFAVPDARAALLGLLDRLRRVSASHLPGGPDDENELPDEPVAG